MQQEAQRAQMKNSCEIKRKKKIKIIYVFFFKRASKIVIPQMRRFKQFTRVTLIIIVEL